MFLLSLEGSCRAETDVFYGLLEIGHDSDIFMSKTKTGKERGLLCEVTPADLADRRLLFID